MGPRVCLTVVVAAAGLAPSYAASQISTGYGWDLEAVGFMIALLFHDGSKTWQNTTGAQPRTSDQVFGFGVRLIVDPGLLKSPRPASATIGPNYSLSTGTPVLPFVGNQTLIAGGRSTSDGKSLFVTALHRQPDCSLALELIQLGAATPASAVIASLPNAQDYLRQLSGLSGQASRFSRGCSNSVLGMCSVTTAAPVGQFGNLLVVADLNPANDTLELLTADAVANKFSTQSLLPTRAFSFYVADMNGDGANDLVANGVADPKSQLTGFAILLNNGNGTFQAPRYLKVPNGGSFFSVDDLNDDGKLDLIAQNGFDQGVTVFLGHGDATFNPGVSSAPDLVALGSALATGDFNGDAKKDLYVQGTVLFGAGDGTFTPGPSVPANYLIGPYVAVSDLDLDGKPDLATSGFGFVQIFFGNGPGTFRPGPAYASAPSPQPVTITDLDGDGYPDLVLGNSSQGLFVQGLDNPLLPMIQVLMAKGDGTFVGAPIYSGQDATVYRDQGALADFLGTGRNQAIFSQSVTSNGVTVSELALVPIDRDANFGPTTIIPLQIRPTIIRAADLDGNASPDVVIAGFLDFVKPVVSVLFNQGQGLLGSEQNFLLPNPPINVAVDDFNGDGRKDLAVAVAPPNGQTGASGVYVLFGSGNGNFTAAEKVDDSVNPVALAVGDLNGDGRADLVIGDEGTGSHGLRSSGLLRVYLGNTNSKFQSVTAPITTAHFYTAVALGDFNQDGRLDLAVAGAIGDTLGALQPQVYLLHGRGDGTFKAVASEPLSGSDGIGARSLALADFNGDGRLDIALANPNDFTEIIVSDNQGGFAHTLMALGQQPYFLTAGPITHDRFADLVVAGAGAGPALFQNIGSAAIWSPGTPALAIARTSPMDSLHSSGIVLTWPSDLSGFKLQATTNLGPSAAWSPVSALPATANGKNSLTNASSGERLFYRLGR